MNNLHVRRTGRVAQPKVKLRLSDLKKRTTDVAVQGAPAAGPVTGHTLAYNNGPLIPNVQVFTVFLGASWSNNADRQTLANNLNTFFSTILSGPLIDQLAEYNVPAYTIGYGALLDSVTIADQPAGNYTDTQLRDLLRGWIAAGTVPAPTGNTLYFIYNDESVNITWDDGGAMCDKFCGYHDVSDANTYYAVVPYPACQPCLNFGGLTDFQALTGTSSHELCESITDPVPGKGWYEAVGDGFEIGDICAWQFKTVAGYNVQLEWSNAQNACV